MITGAQLFAPEGYLSLSKGITYYFLLNDPAHNRARLVEFNHQGRKIQSSLVTMTTFEFEEGLEAGLIEEVRSADNYPPWLEPIKGVEVSHLEIAEDQIKKPMIKRLIVDFSKSLALSLVCRKFWRAMTLTP